VLTTTNGLAIAHRLISLYPEMRALFVSEERARALSDEGLLPEEPQFLAKPFTAEELARKVTQTNRSPCSW
jgi:two-component SAPR family response regulator